MLCYMSKSKTTERTKEDNRNECHSIRFVGPVAQKKTRKGKRERITYINIISRDSSRSLVPSNLNPNPGPSPDPNHPLEDGGSMMSSENNFG